MINDRKYPLNIKYFGTAGGLFNKALSYSLMMSAA